MENIRDPNGSLPLKSVKPATSLKKRIVLAGFCLHRRDIIFCLHSSSSPAYPTHLHVQPIFNPTCYPTFQHRFRPLCRRVSAQIDGASFPGHIAPEEGVLRALEYVSQKMTFEKLLGEEIELHLQWNSSPSEICSISDGVGKRSSKIFFFSDLDLGFL